MPHFEEEDILFRSGDDVLVKWAYNEHKQINEGIMNLHFSTQEETASFISKIADLIGENVRFEERELFPYLGSMIREPELIEIGKDKALKTRNYARCV